MDAVGGLFVLKPGDRFGRLVVLERPINAKVRCLCDCGTERTVHHSALTGGRTRSCGCLNRELSGSRRSRLTHGHSSTPEYRIWVGIVERCFSPRSANYARYGARGISMDETWRSDFMAFLAEVGPRPSVDHSIERIDNSKGYFPGNVRWATRSEQQRNTSRTRLITFNGKTQCLSAWAEELGLKKRTLHKRLTTMTTEQALTQPLQKQDHRKRKK